MSGARSGEPGLTPEAFIAIVREHHQPLRRFAQRILNDRDAAEDALQDAYLKAFRAGGTFRAESSVEAWLRTIVYRCCLDRIRKFPAVAPLPDTELPADDECFGGTNSAGNQVLDRLMVQDAMAKLSAEHRAVIWLIEGEGMTVDAAAKVMDIPRGTAASRLSRARLRLRQALSLADPPPVTTPIERTSR